MEHRIDTGNSQPQRESLRRHPIPHLQHIDEQVQQMLDANIIEPSTSPWSANVVLAKNHDGTLRFAIDFRKLNNVTTSDVYPIPRIDNCLATLEDEKWFSTIDLRASFWQVAQSKEDAPKTAFVTRRGLFQFRTVAFGLRNATSTFQRCMDLVMSGLTWKQCIVYVDDIVCYSKTLEDHIAALAEILARLRQYNLKIKPDKCQFFRTEITFLGYRISADGVSTDPQKISAVLNWKPSRNIKELRSFLGSASYYRNFISQFSRISAPVYALTKKAQI